MTKKSAAKFEIAGKKPEPSTIKEALQNLKLPPIEDVFEKQKKGMLSTIEIQIRQDSRFDTLMAIKQSCDRFFPNADSLDLDDVKAIAEQVKLQHEKVKAIIEELELDAIIAEDFANPCDSLVDFDEPKDWRDVFEQSVFFSAIQPYGQAFDDLHGRMMEEAAKRDA